MNQPIESSLNDHIIDHSPLLHCIKKYIDKGVFSYLDYYSAKTVSRQQDDQIESHQRGIALITLLISRAYRYGHIVLPIDYLLDSSQWFHEENIDDRESLIGSLLDYAGIQSSSDWLEILAEIKAPLIKNDYGIYLEKQYRLESRLVNFIDQSSHPITFNQTDKKFITEALDRYFYSNESLDWQRVAAINTLLQPISIISGGPGTGKTTTIFNILLIFLELREMQKKTLPQIVLSAPTGKAAARLTESINGQKRALEENHPDATMHHYIPQESFTLHRLLGIDPITQVPRYNRDNPLSLDLLVVDEASMIDISMFVKVIDALPNDARLILLGDRDQLSSVEAGSVMYELCQQEGYSKQHRHIIESMLGEALPPNQEEYSFDYLSVLKRSYRFNDQSQLGELARCINREANYLEKQRELMEILTRESDNNQVKWYSLPTDKAHLNTIIQKSFEEYKTRVIDDNASIESIFKAFNRVRFLAAQRRGEYGTDQLNKTIAEILFSDALPIKNRSNLFYNGLAIMIEENDYNYQLFNGDIGLVIEREGSLRVYFEGEEGIKEYSTYSLPKHNPAFAMTVHKSQGSEFDHLFLFLGDYPSAFLTKELFYTGVTRAKESVTIFSAESALNASIKQRTNRFSFIHQRLLDAKESKES